MRSVAKRTTKLILVGTLLTALLGGAAPSASAATTNPAERQMAARINDSRTRYGRKTLRLNASLSEYARRHSARMAAAGDIYHNKNLPRDLDHWDWTVLGENVGVGPSLAALHSAFMDSKGHRSNVLDREWYQMGIGVVSADGHLWVTEIFYG